MLCFECHQYSPSDVSTNAHEETLIVSSYILRDFDAFHTLHDSHDSVHHMHSMNNNALYISYDEYDDEHVEFPSCDVMLHRISCENSFGHIMFEKPLNLSYAMSEISHIASFQSQHSDYACPIKINPICTYGIDDEMVVIGFFFM